MYEFRDTNEHLNDSWLPSVAMQFNGFLLEEEIRGYHTLNVEGRETISYNLEDSGNISGRDGVISFGKTLPPRVLRIQYLLKAESNEELQHSFRLLNWKLKTEGEVPIRFRDDLEIMYYGQLVGMSDVPPETNSVVGTFEIHCSDPYKYEKNTSQVGNPLTIYLPTPYEVKPELIEVIVKSTVTKLIVANITTGRRIILNGSYVSGDTIRIRLNETGQGNKITKNNQNIMKELDYLATDFNTFIIKKGDIIQVTPNTATLTVQARGRWK